MEHHRDRLELTASNERHADVDEREFCGSAWMSRGNPSASRQSASTLTRRTAAQHHFPSETRVCRVTVTLQIQDWCETVRGLVGCVQYSKDLSLTASSAREELSAWRCAATVCYLLFAATRDWLLCICRMLAMAVDKDTATSTFVPEKHSRLRLHAAVHRDEASRLDQLQAEK